MTRPKDKRCSCEDPIRYVGGGQSTNSGVSKGIVRCRRCGIRAMRRRGDCPHARRKLTLESDLSTGILSCTDCGTRWELTKAEFEYYTELGIPAPPSVVAE